jgi:Holliday junction resolvase
MMPDFNNTILEILKQTKENGVITKENRVVMRVLEDFGIHRSKEGMIVVDREKRIDLAMCAVERGQDIAEVIGLLTWKDFEGLIATILAENGFRSIESYRRRGNDIEKGMEIDVIGIQGPVVLSIDAKMWGIRGGKAAALRTAAVKQKERTMKLVANSEHLSKKIQFETQRDYEFFPILVTWLVEEVELFEGVPVVPIFKFNSFIVDFETYRDLIVSYPERSS